MSDSLKSYHDDLKDEAHKEREKHMNKMKRRIHEGLEEMNYDELAEFIRLLEHKKDIVRYFELSKILSRQLG